MAWKEHTLHRTPLCLNPPRPSWYYCRSKPGTFTEEPTTDVQQRYIHSRTTRSGFKGLGAHPYARLNVWGEVSFGFGALRQHVGAQPWCPKGKPLFERRVVRERSGVGGKAPICLYNGPRTCFTLPICSSRSFCCICTTILLIQVGDRYTLVKLLGHGSFSTVCLASDAFTEEKVPSVLWPDLPPDAFPSQFQPTILLERSLHRTRVQTCLLFLEVSCALGEEGL